MKVLRVNKNDSYLLILLNIGWRENTGDTLSQAKSIDLRLFYYRLPVFPLVASDPLGVGILMVDVVESKPYDWYLGGQTFLGDSLIVQQIV